MSSHKKWSSKGKGAEELEDIRKEQKVAFLLHLSYLLLTVFTTFLSLLLPMCLSSSVQISKTKKNNWTGRIFPPIYFGRNVGFPYINLYVLTQSIKSVPVWCVSNWIERNRVEERKDGNLEYEEELLLFSYHIISVSTKVTLNFTDPSNFAKPCVRWKMSETKIRFMSYLNSHMLHSIWKSLKKSLIQSFASEAS